MLKLPPKPELWNMETLLVSHADVKGALAKWAVRLSPYEYPSCLRVAIHEFMRYWHCVDPAQMSSDRLRLLIEITISHCPTIQSWGKPKKVLVLKDVLPLDPVDPDYHSIGLQALARNMTHDIVLEAQIDKAQDEHMATTNAFYGTVEPEPEVMDVREIDFLSVPVMPVQTVFESTPRKFSSFYFDHYIHMVDRHSMFIFGEPMLSLTDEQIAEARKEVGGIKPTYKEDDPEYATFPMGWETR